MMKKILVLSCALVLASLSTAAAAAEGQGFVGAEVGRTEADFDINGFGSASDSDTSYSLRGGYYFTNNFAVEGSYNNLYDKKDNGAQLKLNSFGIGVLGKKNFGVNDSGFFVDGRAGLEIVQGDADDAFGSSSENSTEFYFGAGVGYDFNESWGLSLNYYYHQAGFEGVDVNADTVNVGGEYRF
jgi:opacity protein-like surface antigen